MPAAGACLEPHSHDSRAPLPRYVTPMLLLSTLAHAAQVTEAEMQRWVVELVPKVEAAAGQTFVQTPTLVLDQRKYVQRALDAQADRVNEQWPNSAPTHSQIPEGVLALYTPETFQIYVISEAIVEVFAEIDDDARFLAPFTRCTIAHELTHALQHQRAHMPLDGWSNLGLHALAEGQATRVAHAVCGDALAADLSDASSHSDMVSSDNPEDDNEFLYGYGTRYVERLLASGGMRAVWDSFAAPPTRAEIIAAVQPTLASGWRETKPLASVLDVLSEGRGEATHETISPTALFGELHAGGINEASILPAEGGVTGTRIADDRVFTAHAFRLRDGTAATNWVNHRGLSLARGEATIFAGRNPPLYSIHSSASYRVPALRDLSADATLSLRLGFQPGAYRELWVARDGVMVGVTAYTAKGTLPKLDESVRALLAAYPSFLPPITALSSRPPPAPEDPLSARYLLDQMALDVSRGDYAGCAAKAVNSLASVPPTHRAVIAERGRACAAHSAPAIAPR